MQIFPEISLKKFAVISFMSWTRDIDYDNALVTSIDYSEVDEERTASTEVFIPTNLFPYVLLHPAVSHGEEQKELTEFNLP